MLIQPPLDAFLITVNGLPAHALVVHAAVVLGPVAVLGALAYLVPRWHDYLRWPVLVLAVLAFVSIWAAYLTGGNFRDSAAYFRTGALGEQIDRHQEYADVLRWVTTAFAVVVVAVTARLHARAGALRLVSSGALAVLAVAVLVYVVLTGEAGAKAVYPPSAATATAVTGTAAAVSTR